MGQQIRKPPMKKKSKKKKNVKGRNYGRTRS